MFRILTLLSAILFCSVSFSQTPFWSDSFEDAGAPSIGTRVATGVFSCGTPATAYFFRTTPGALALQSGSYSGYEGSKIWAGEDIDKGAACSGSTQSGQQTVTWSSIDISGKTGISFKGLFAANGVNGSWQGLWWGSAQDKIEVEYRIDGGSWIRIIGIYSNQGATSAASNTFALDTDGDQIGDGVAINYSFTELTAPISGTGAVLDLRLVCHANSTAAQEVAADNFRLFTSSTVPVQLLRFSGSGRENGNELKWATSSESENSHFEVERSFNGSEFQVIGTVTGQGNSGVVNEYLFRDANPTASSVLYRLKQVDWDGHYSYSQVIQVRNDFRKTMTIYPNPFSSSLIVDIGHNSEASKTQLLDLAGREVSLPSSRAGNLIFYETSGLPSGVYVLRLQVGNQVSSKAVYKL